MNSSLDRFQAVWTWHRVAVRALNVFEQDVKVHPEGHLDDLRAESQQSVLVHVAMCRDELEDFVLLSLWALFEEALNDWLAQRVKWAGVTSEFDQGIRSGLAMRVQRWDISEKIKALNPLIGEETAKSLRAVLEWRNWVAHRKTGARPAAVDLEMAQSLFIAVLTRLELCPVREAEALS